MDVKEQLKEKPAQEAIRHYAIADQKKDGREFPMISVDPNYSDEKQTTLTCSSTDQAKKGDGDFRIRVSHYDGQVKLGVDTVDKEKPDKKSFYYLSQDSLDNITKLYGTQTEREMEKSLKGAYKSFLAAKSQETGDVNTAVNRTLAEQKYDSLKHHALETHTFTPQKIQGMEQLLMKEEDKNGYKQNFKEQVLDDIHPTSEEEQYKENYKNQLMSALGLDKDKDEKQQRLHRSENESPSDQQKRVDEMKEFEKNHSFDETYNLKKEALQEIKEMNLSHTQMEKVLKIEKVLDAEKQEHDKGKEQGDSKEQKNGFKGLFTRHKGATKSKQSEHEMER